MVKGEAPLDDYSVRWDFEEIKSGVLEPPGSLSCEAEYF
jgi:hypothetical protein